MVLSSKSPQSHFAVGGSRLFSIFKSRRVRFVIFLVFDPIFGLRFFVFINEEKNYKKRR